MPQHLAFSIGPDEKALEVLSSQGANSVGHGSDYIEAIRAGTDLMEILRAYILYIQGASPRESTVEREKAKAIPTNVFPEGIQTEFLNGHDQP
jgi:hypothetical protein